METLIVICLLVIILLLLQDKIEIKRISRKGGISERGSPILPEIMGKPKQNLRQLLPSTATESQKEIPAKQDSTFDTEIKQIDVGLVIPQEELDEIFGAEPDLEAEEEDWRGYGAPNGEGGLAVGVTFEELNTVGTLLQQEVPEPALHERAVDIVHKIQGTDLLSLLENAMPDASQKIARLLDQGIGTAVDSGSSTMRNNNLDDFNIGEFV